MKHTKSHYIGTQIIAGFALVIALWASTAVASPRSFEAMYAAAARGDVPALRNAVHRGLRIDSPNAAGDTGVCAAIKRNDYQAYNSFILAGARRYPGCLNRISASKYRKFIKSDQIVPFARNQYTPPVNATPSGGGFAPRYISDRQMNIVQRELNYTAQTGNAYNLLYLPVSVLLSLFP